MATSLQVVFDCTDPDRLAGFWAAALNYIVQPPPQGYSDWPSFLREHGMEDRLGNVSAIVDPDGAGPRVYFQKVPEPKSVKNRVHLDLNISDGRRVAIEERRLRIESEADRLIALGARQVSANEDGDNIWTVMQDPEGNEFCIQ